ncbi:MAG: 5-formyltetrahydrofolate cyclo-ligase [Gammaproteobacteria bacterium]|nr:5-formyltetrahydrofolate cyclo-ligase [Gammaproteobacteria bacterium]
MNSDQLRQRNRKLRSALTKEALEKSAQRLCQQIIALRTFRQAQHIAAYFAVNGEIGLDPVVDHALAIGKNIYLPSLDNNSLRFAPYFRDQKMRINSFKLPEPDVSDAELLQPDELDLVLAPLVVFDANCNRIGMGGGFYDRSFAFRKQGVNKPLLLGVAHELQKVDAIKPQAWDVRLDMVVTEQAAYGIA